MHVLYAMYATAWTDLIAEMSVKYAVVWADLIVETMIVSLFLHRIASHSRASQKLPFLIKMHDANPHDVWQCIAGGCRPCPP